MSTPHSFPTFLSPIYPESLGLVPFTLDLNRFRLEPRRYEARASDLGIKRLSPVSVKNFREIYISTGRQGCKHLIKKPGIKFSYSQLSFYGLLQENEKDH